LQAGRIQERRPYYGFTGFVRHRPRRFACCSQDPLLINHAARLAGAGKTKLALVPVLSQSHISAYFDERLVPVLQQSNILKAHPDSIKLLSFIANGMKQTAETEKRFYWP